jgi:hypothetical protein
MNTLAGLSRPIGTTPSAHGSTAPTFTSTFFGNGANYDARTGAKVGEIAFGFDACEK